MNSRFWIIVAAIAIVTSCTPAANETVYTYNSQENFWISVKDAEVEFVKDNVEYVKFMGNYTTPGNFLRVTLDTFTTNYPYSYLLVQGSDYGVQDLHKVEVHYINFKRLTNAPYVPISLGSANGSIIYTREALVKDSIDLNLCYWQDSVIEVNTQSLKLFGGYLIRSNLKGFAHKLEMNVELKPDCVTQNTLYRYGQLTTDSTNVYLYTSLMGCTYYDFQTKIYVHANDFLEINAGGIAGGLNGNSYNCPTCLCEIYYTGYPTILNHDSLNPKVVIIDNN